jgi:hypothetical protein
MRLSFLPGVFRTRNRKRLRKLPSASRRVTRQLENPGTGGNNTTPALNGHEVKITSVHPFPEFVNLDGKHSISLQSPRPGRAVSQKLSPEMPVSRYILTLAALFSLFLYSQESQWLGNALMQPRQKARLVSSCSLEFISAVTLEPIVAWQQWRV